MSQKRPHFGGYGCVFLFTTISRSEASPGTRCTLKSSPRRLGTRRNAMFEPLSGSELDRASFGVSTWRSTSTRTIQVSRLDYPTLLGDRTPRQDGAGTSWGPTLTQEGAGASSHDAKDVFLDLSCLRFDSQTSCLCRVFDRHPPPPPPTRRFFVRSDWRSS